jgi:CRP-like cAMP-binding protein
VEFQQLGGAANARSLFNRFESFAVRNARPPSDAERSRLVMRLRSIGDLSAAAEAALRDLPMQVRELDDNQDFAKEGDRPFACCLVLDGFVCRYKLVADGKRQILSFHISGDIPDLQSLQLKTLDHNLGTLTPSRLGFLQHEDLRKLISDFPGLGSLFWRTTLIDAALFREWMVGLGRRNAHQRLAHLICEMLFRAQAVGLTHDHNFPLPLTQLELADALGLTVVHVNRVLRSLRESDILKVDRSGVRILDWPSLEALAEFDPLYLHQK